MELNVLKIDGTPSGKKVVLDEKVFGIEPNDHVIWLDVVQYLANQRQGTAKAKDRSEVAYSTKKLGRQKGGGGARHGSIKSNIYVGGGNVFGPKPRDYDFKLNKKVKQLARFSALSYKAKENAITMVEPFTMEAPKTKDRSEIAHSTKKLGRQKGGGGARHGSLKANIFVGGGRVFGPQPRFYHNKLNKKVKALARKSALTYKAQENAIIVLEPFAMDAPKTKELLGITSAIKAGDRKVLYVLPQNSANIYLSSRNLPQVDVLSVDEINTYAIMNANTLVLVDGVQDILAERNMR